MPNKGKPKIIAKPANKKPSAPVKSSGVEREDFHSLINMVKEGFGNVKEKLDSFDSRIAAVEKGPKPRFSTAIVQEREEEAGRRGAPPKLYNDFPSLVEGLTPFDLLETTTPLYKQVPPGMRHGIMTVIDLVVEMYNNNEEFREEFDALYSEKYEERLNAEPGSASSSDDDEEEEVEEEDNE